MGSYNRKEVCAYPTSGDGYVDWVGITCKVLRQQDMTHFRVLGLAFTFSLRYANHCESTSQDIFASIIVSMTYVQCFANHAA